MKKALLLLLVLFSLSFSYYYPYIVNASDHTIMTLVYDDASFSYADNSLENPDAELRLCADTAAELQNKWVAMIYADGTNPGDYIEITHYPLQITSVPPTNCVYLPIDLSSFKAWYPSIPFVFISDSQDLSGAERVKLVTANGWLVGNYTITETQAGNTLNITVIAALDDGGAPIVPDVDYLVVGVLPDGTLETLDTAITSINDSVLLSLGTYTGTHVIHINGIGPGNFGPIVTILSPQPTTYSSGQIPFTYTIHSYLPIASCWYVLDGQATVMPDCTIPYILNVGDGTHTLFLYANDTAGQTGFDSVTFQVSSAPPTPPLPGGPGSPHVPQPEVPIEPPPFVPPEPEFFSINPEDIVVEIHYPLEGEANFTLYSTSHLTDVSCFLTADFGQYTRIELASDEIQPNSTINGKIIVDMPPTEILDYNGDYEGLLQCVGKYEGGPTLMLSTAANVYLEIYEPQIEVQEELFTLLLFENLPATLNLTNVGNGTAYAYNLSILFSGPQGELFSVLELPAKILHGESALARILIQVPLDYAPGTYKVPVNVYENGRFMGGTILTLVIGYEIAPPVCHFPIFLNYVSFWDMDIPWAIILILSLATYLLLQSLKESRLEKERIKPLPEKERRKEALLLHAKLLLIAFAPAFLALPGFWIFEPCFMMNVALLEFIIVLFKKLRQMGKEKRKKRAPLGEGEAKE